MSIANQIMANLQKESTTDDATGRLRQSEQRAAKLAADLRIERELRRHVEAELANSLLRQQHLDAIGDPSDLGWSEEKRSGGGRATAIVVLTDWHIEERVDPRTINGMNEFSPKIAGQRIKRAVAKACQLIDAERAMSRIGNLVVALLGDMITGYIHDELEESNWLSPTEASLCAQDNIASSLSYLAKHSGCRISEIVCLSGNHGRTTKKMRISTAYKNSYEWLMYHNLARALPGLPWRIADGYTMRSTIQGKNIRFHHGNGLKYQGGVGGITIPVLKAIAAWDRSWRADLDVFGHWHQFLAHPKFVSCNCLIGYGPYAEFIKAEYSPPSQTLIVLDRDRPRPVTVKEIYCD